MPKRCSACLRCDRKRRAGRATFRSDVFLPVSQRSKRAVSPQVDPLAPRICPRIHHCFYEWVASLSGESGDQLDWALGPSREQRLTRQVGRNRRKTVGQDISPAECTESFLAVRASVDFSQHLNTTPRPELSKRDEIRYWHRQPLPSEESQPQSACDLIH